MSKKMYITIEYKKQCVKERIIRRINNFVIYFKTTKKNHNIILYNNLNEF